MEVIIGKISKTPPLRFGVRFALKLKAKRSIAYHLLHGYLPKL